MSRDGRFGEPIFDDRPFAGSASVRAEWRAEEEEWSRAALERWEHGRSLADVLRDARQRGDVASIVLPSVTWSGAVVAVGDDVVRLDTGARCVDVRLGVDARFVLRVRVHARDDVGGGDAALTTFTARLRELDGTPVSIGTPVGSLEGCLRIGHDQVRVTDGDGGIAYVPTGSVSWVGPRVDD